MAGERRDSIRIRVENTDYEVTGGEFQAILAAVKALPKRRFNAQLKLWEIGGSLAMARGQLENSGFHLEGGKPVPAAEVVEQARASDQLRLEVAGQSLLLSGASFQELLAAIKEVPGRRFDAETKLWSVPGTLAEIQAYFEKRGMHLERPGTPPPTTIPRMTDQDFDEAEIEWQPPRSAAVPPPPPPDDLFPPFEANEDFFEAEDFDEPLPLPHEPPAAAPPARPAAAPTSGSGRRDQIRVSVGSMALVVTGGAFQAMLAAIKAIPGRRFDSTTKRWLLPDDINSIQQHLKESGFRLDEE